MTSAAHQNSKQHAMGGVARGSSANLMGIAILAACTMIITVAISRNLSKESAGVFFSTTSIFVLLTIVGQLGANTGLVYFISRARGQGVAQTAPRYLAIALGPVIFTAVFMGAILFIFSHEISTLINPDHINESTQYLKVFAFFIPLAGYENITLAATRGLGAMRANVVVEQIGRPIFQLVAVLVALYFTGSGWLGLAWALGYLPAAVASRYWWRKSPLSREPNDLKQQTKALRIEFWKFSAPRALASVGQSAIQRMDIVLVGAIAGAQAAAIYTASTRFLVIGQMGTRAISLAVQPRLGVALGARDFGAAKELYKIATAWLMVLTWPMFLIFIVFADRILQIFGKGYQSGQDVLLLLSLAMLVATGCGMVDMVLNMAGKTSWNMMNVLLSVGIQLGLDIALIPGYGIYGAAIGWAVALVLSNLIPLAQIWASMKLHPFGRATLVAGLLPIICFGGLAQAIRQQNGNGWNSLFIAIIAGGICYLPLLWVMRKPLQLSAIRGIRAARPKAKSTAIQQ